jgi:uncharacterized membrane protein YfcA
MLVPLRREVQRPALALLGAGTAAGTPIGVWILAALPVSVLTRLIRVTLLGIVALEWLGFYPERLGGRRGAIGAGVAAGGGPSAHRDRRSSSIPPPRDGHRAPQRPRCRRSSS